MINKKDEAENTGYAFAQPPNQNCSFPYGFKNYIYDKCSSKAYSKLTKSCKLFIAQKRILVVDGIRDIGCWYLIKNMSN